MGQDSPFSLGFLPQSFSVTALFTGKYGLKVGSGPLSLAPAPAPASGPRSFSEPGEWPFQEAEVLGWEGASLPEGSCRVASSMELLRGTGSGWNSHCLQLTMSHSLTREMSFCMGVTGGSLVSDFCVRLTVVHFFLGGLSGWAPQYLGLAHRPGHWEYVLGLPALLAPRHRDTWMVREYCSDSSVWLDLVRVPLALFHGILSLQSWKSTGMQAVVWGGRTQQFWECCASTLKLHLRRRIWASKTSLAHPDQSGPPRGLSYSKGTYHQHPRLFGHSYHARNPCGPCSLILPCPSVASLP